MDKFRVINDTEGERQAWFFNGDELSNALIHFLSLMRYDRRVRLEHIGEEYEEE